MFWATEINAQTDSFWPALWCTISSTSWAKQYIAYNEPTRTRHGNVFAPFTVVNAPLTVRTFRNVFFRSIASNVIQPYRQRSVDVVLVGVTNFRSDVPGHIGSS